ncbi:MAG: NAD(P)/FAD-dependent oxidoreductase [Ruminococcaceae bacterium]|nr:NAD(P)/FAD-dependent oxidoreductase [Oscillospiraceae bacterium]
MGNKVVVIGGGASGLMAAITAAENGCYTTILEKNDRIGKKILSTGNGKCNFTNISASGDDYDSDFANHALNEFSPSDTIEFYKKIGILPKIEDGGRVYPLSCQASSILTALKMYTESLGIYVKTEFAVAKIEQSENGFKIYSKNGECIRADKVIVATGGKAAPKTGSDGDGYRLLKAIGHSYTEIKPALCQLPTNKGVHGVRQYGKITLSGKYTQVGEIQFNKDSISGIPVLNLSRYAKVGDAINLDFMPDYSYEEVLSILTKHPCQIMENYLTGILNKNLALAILKDIGIIPLSRMSDTLDDFEFKKIAKALKGWELKVTSAASWDNAQVTSGGVKCEEVSPDTMESKLVHGLYIVGELCDVDASCGGYNLQWAWSSGYLAGREASKCTK